MWDRCGPPRTKHCFMEFEVSVHDGAYKGQLHSHVPVVGRKILTIGQKTYHDVHGYYRTWVEHLFAHLWSWRVVRYIWLGLIKTCMPTHAYSPFWTIHVAQTKVVSALLPMGTQSFFHLDKGTGP